MSHPGLASNAANNAVVSNLSAKAQPEPERRGVPLTLSERLLVVAVMIGAWVAMSVLSLLQR